MTLTWDDRQVVSGYDKARRFVSSRPFETRGHLGVRGPDVQSGYELLQEQVHGPPGVDAVGAVQNNHNVHRPSACWKHNDRRLTYSDVSRKTSTAWTTQIIINVIASGRVSLWTAGEKAG